MLATMLAALSSCNKNDQVTPSNQVTDASALPAKAVSYTVDNYPDATIEYVLLQVNAAATYIAVLNTTEELAFSKSGDYLGDGKLHRHGHHGGDTIHGDTIHGGGHHGGGHHGNTIPFDSLPVAITGYISANYAGYTVMHAEYDTLCPEGAVSEVMIVTGTSAPLKLVFDANDQFLMQASRVGYSTLPQAVKDYVATNYTSYQVSGKAEKLTMADNAVQYFVYLRLNGVRLKLRMTETGSMVCVRQ